MTRLAVCAGGLLVLLCAACAQDETETVDGGLGYVVEFPSKQAAIAADSLKVLVFGADQDCLGLIQGRKSGTPLPAALAETPAAPVCEYLAGSVGGDIELPPGEYVVFAIAQRENADFLVGCARQRVDATVEHVPVSLNLADEQKSVPQTSCSLLADKCGGRC